MIAFLRRFRQFWLELWCIHDFHLHGEAGVIYQQCFNCDKRRPGWTIDAGRAKRLQYRKRTTDQDRKIVQMKRKGWR